MHFRRITSIYQPTNAHIISHKTILKHFKTLRHVSILSDHHQGRVLATQHTEAPHSNRHRSESRKSHILQNGY